MVFRVDRGENAQAYSTKISMPPSLKELFQPIIDRRNAPELVRRREYYDYLVQTRRTDGQSLAQFIEQFAQIIRYEPAASTTEIAALTQCTGVTLPKALIDFYCELGGLNGQQIRIYAPAQLLGFLSTAAAPYERLEGIGITHLMRHAWGNDRSEFDPKQGLISKIELEQLNARYHCIGVLSSVYCESHTYLYFDQAGRFGTVEYHQDDFDGLLKGRLRPMLRESPATMALEAAVLAWLEMPREDDESEEEYQDDECQLDD